MAQDYFVVWFPKSRTYISYKGYSPILDDAKIYTSSYMARCEAKDREGGFGPYEINRVGFKLLEEVCRSST